MLVAAGKCWFMGESEKYDKQNPDEDVLYRDDVRMDAKEEEERALRCLKCGWEITTEKQRISVQDSHEHTFVNPGGYVYRIGCFREAPGCVLSGEGSSEHTWFKGYAWSYAACSSCLTHLGWSYGFDPDKFFGLILERLGMD